MRCVKFAAGAALIAVVTCLPARAEIFNFSYSGPGFTASGTLTATLQSDNAYRVTAISGTRDGVAITGLVAVNGYFTNTNLLYFPAGGSNPAGTGFFDDVTSGLAYSIGGTRYIVGLRGGGPLYDEIRSDEFGATTFDTLSSLEVTSTPIPLPGAGMLSYLFVLLGVAVRWRRTLRQRLGEGWNRLAINLARAIATRPVALALREERSERLL